LTGEGPVLRNRRGEVVQRPEGLYAGNNEIIFPELRKVLQSETELEEKLERPPVNRRVASSNLVQGGKLFFSIIYVS
jgi:hypothetical protein